MPLKNGTIKLKKEADFKGQRRYVRKADRGFAPDWTDIRPSSLNLAERLYAFVRENQSRRPQSRVYASQISECARKMVFNMWEMKAETPQAVLDNPQWAVTAEIGTVIHDLIEVWLKNEGELIDSEFRVQSPDGAVSGRVDALMWGLEDSAGTVLRSAERVVVDVKTVGKKDFEQGTWGWKVEKYQKQLQLYGNILGVEKAVVLLVCRDDGRMFDFEFPIHPEQGEVLMRRATQIVEMADRMIVPPAESLGTKACDFCSFQRACQAEEETGAVSAAIENNEDLREV